MSDKFRRDGIMVENNDRRYSTSKSRRDDIMVENSGIFQHIFHHNVIPTGF